MTTDPPAPDSFVSTRPDAPTGDIAVIGDGAENGHSVSMKALQAIYGEITGKSEELSKRFETSFQVSMPDLEDLNHKMQQVCEQYSIQASTTSVTLYHLDDTKEEFSSFERFRIYNASSASPVESIVLKYSFLIVLPKTRKAQSYTLTVRLASRITALKRLRRESQSLATFSRVIRIMTGQTAVVTISYVDYMVARTLLVVADGWFAALPTGSTPAWLAFIRKHVERLHTLTEYALSGLSLFLILRLLPSQLPELSQPALLARVLLLGGSALFVAYRLGHYLGEEIEDAIDSWQELSFLKLNRGDELEINAATRANRSTLLRALLNAGGGFLSGVLASLVANWLMP